ncbi:MAG TPA: amidohydrolase [Bacteroidia bacterium]|jgi:predicted amidohydrolase YtcJ|nr:amidohydrolase [Bacteroidia bacterium]
MRSPFSSRALRVFAPLQLIIAVLLFHSCGSKKQHVDLILKNGNIYTVDGGFAVLQSFAVKDGKFVAIGTNESIDGLYEADSVIDAKSNTVLPGLIDAHCHFVNYGLGLQECDLVGTKSFAEVIERVKKYAATNKNPWIIGRGWDQNDWDVKQFPDNTILDSLFPNTPLILKRIDGHAALVNRKALDIAGINDSTEVSGGEIKKRYWIGTTELGPEISASDLAHPGRKFRYNVQTITSQLTGILIDNAVDLVESKIPEPSADILESSLEQAQANCFAVGLTTVDDAGLLKNKIDAIDQLQKNGKLKMRVYAMLSDSAPNYDYYLAHGPYKTDRLDVRSFKFYADGALGSRGACLLSNYSDQPGWKGFLLNTPQHFEDRMKQVAAKGFQVCTHCIGDSANRFMLNLYSRIMPDSTCRWRIEHAQVVSPADVPFFNMYGIIPSVQPTHATSDMYWAGKRLGDQRLRSAYAYNDLLKSAGLLALGTDFPVEDINPFYTFYAAVGRMDLQQFPAGGFQMENALTRRDALKGMTTWAAYSNFEENEKGSIEPGKFADFIIINKDIMTCDVKDIPDTKVLYTFVGGENVYAAK